MAASPYFFFRYKASASVLRGFDAVIVCWLAAIGVSWLLLPRWLLLSTQRFHRLRSSSRETVNYATVAAMHLCGVEPRPA